MSIENSLFSTILDGGILMLVIALMGSLGIFVVSNRIIYFKDNEKNNFEDVKQELKEYIKRKDASGAIAFLDNYKGSTFSVLKELIMEWDESKEVDIILLEEKAREAGLSKLPELESRMWLLGIVAHTTPLIGLLGTVTGMIQAFQAISVHGTGDPAVLAEGISKALVTTAGGLTVAIPALIFYNFFNKKIDVIVNEMEKASVELINFFRR